jgi:hypothetical protein
VTCGVAIDVPLIVFVAVLLPIQSEVTLVPGALISTHDPKFEYDANASVIVEALTVIAVGSLDGEKLHALQLLFPAATAYVTPEAIEFLTARFMAVE